MAWLYTVAILTLLSLGQVVDSSRNSDLSHLIMNRYDELELRQAQDGMIQRANSIIERAEGLLDPETVEKFPKEKKKAIVDTVSQVIASSKTYLRLLKRGRLRAINGRRALASATDTLENLFEILDHAHLYSDPKYSPIKYKLKRAWKSTKRKAKWNGSRIKTVLTNAVFWRAIGFEDDDDDVEEYNNIYLKAKGKDDKKEAPKSQSAPHSSGPNHQVPENHFIPQLGPLNNGVQTQMIPMMVNVPGPNGQLIPTVTLVPYPNIMPVQGQMPTPTSSPPPPPPPTNLENPE